MLEGFDLIFVRLEKALDIDFAIGICGFGGLGGDVVLWALWEASALGVGRHLPAVCVSFSRRSAGHEL
jgi:hypothetical protein